MPRRVSLLNLTKEIEKMYKDYSEEIQKEIKKVIMIYSKEIIDQIRRTAPRSNAKKFHLADSFVVVPEDRMTDFLAIIFSPTKGFIAHLLEFGTSKMPAQPFMRRAYDKWVPQMQRDIQKVIEEAGGK